MKTLLNHTFCGSKIGLSRTENQDNYLYCNQKKIWCVADGMGGHEHGAIASEYLVKAVRSYFIGLSDVSVEDLVSVLHEVNNDLYLHSKEHSVDVVGTTLVLVCVIEEDSYILWVGDSRLYLVRNDSVYMLTEDHKKVFKKKTSSGSIKRVERLTKAVGMGAGFDVSIKKTKFISNDKILLCTDGFYNATSPQEIFNLTKGDDLLHIKNRFDSHLSTVSNNDDASYSLVIFS